MEAPEIRSVAVDAITVLNPRVRNKRVFQELVTSIAHLGLKKPITVSQRSGKSRYDLVCGQGRLEAFVALGQTHIPAIVIDAPEDDCFVMSLVENLARRLLKPMHRWRALVADLFPLGLGVVLNAHPMSSMMRASSTSSKLAPSPARMARWPVTRSYRRTMVST